MQIERRPEIKDSSKVRPRTARALVLTLVSILMSVGAIALAACGHIWVDVDIGVSDARATETAMADNMAATPTAPELNPIPTHASEFVRLTYDPAEHSHPALSPDGQTVVFISDRAGRPDVFRTSVTGGQLINLTWTPSAQEDTPIFTPDGTAIAFASDQDGDWSIYLMDTDGANVRPALSDHASSDEVHPTFTPNGLALASAATVLMATGISTLLPSAPASGRA